MFTVFFRYYVILNNHLKVYEVLCNFFLYGVRNLWAPGLVKTLFYMAFIFLRFRNIYFSSTSIFFSLPFKTGFLGSCSCFVDIFLFGRQFSYRDKVLY